MTSRPGNSTISLQYINIFSNLLIVENQNVHCEFATCLFLYYSKYETFKNSFKFIMFYILLQKLFKCFWVFQAATTNNVLMFVFVYYLIKKEQTQEMAKSIKIFYKQVKQMLLD